MSNETESLGDSNEPNPNQTASFFVTLEVIVLLSFLPVVLLDLRSRKVNRSQDAKRTKLLMIAVFVSNFVFQAIFMMHNTACFDCNIENSILVATRHATKGINFLFLIHRANIVQGMSPILGKVWFEKILPAVAVLFTLGYTISTTRDIMMLKIECNAYADTDTLKTCVWHRDDQEERVLERIHLWAWFGIALDGVIVTFLIILFIVPLYRVYRQDLGHMNSNQLRQRKKVWRLLVWSVVLTFMNQVSTTAGAMFLVVDLQPYPLLILPIGFAAKFDPSINVWTSWLMVNRNRSYLQSVCCCGGTTSSRRQSQQIQSRGMTDPHSANSVPKLTSRYHDGINVTEDE